MSLLRAPHPANGTISGSDAVHEIMKPHTSRAVVRTMDSDMNVLRPVVVPCWQIFPLFQNL